MAAEPAPLAAPHRGSLWSSVLHTFGSNALALLFSVGSSVLLARTLGPQGKGSYDLLLATAALLSMLLNLSLPAGATYVVARGLAAPRRLIRGLIPWIGLQTGLGLLLLLGMASSPLAPAFLPPELPAALPACLALLALLLASGYWRAILFGLQQIPRANRIDLGTQALWLGLLLSALLTLQLAGAPLTAPLALSLYLLAALGGNLLFAHALARSSSESAGASAIRPALRYALACYSSNLVQFLNYRLDIFLVGYFLGVAAVGLYTLAVSLAQLVWLLSNATALVLLPHVAAQEALDPQQNRLRTAQAARLTVWIAVLPASLLALSAGFLLPLVYGANFQASVAPLLGLLPGVVLFSLVNVLAAYLAGIGKPQLNLSVALLGLAVTVPLDLLLIPRLGIFGAALASSASYGLSALATLTIFVRRSGLPVQHVLLPQAEDRQLLQVGIRRMRLFLRGQAG